MGVEYVSLEELCKESDIISLHIPLFPSTYRELPFPSHAAKSDIILRVKQFMTCMSGEAKIRLMQLHRYTLSPVRFSTSKYLMQIQVSIADHLPNSYLL